jgi:hypothetical protein
MWITYYIPAYWVVSGMGGGALAYFAVFLKNLKTDAGTPVWTVDQVNAIPIGGGAVQVVMSTSFFDMVEGNSLMSCLVWFWCILSDLLQVRWQLIILQSKCIKLETSFRPIKRKQC